MTPYHEESLEIILRCVDSVAGQTHPCTHVLVADGLPNVALDGLPIQHIRLPSPHNDFGDTPRLIGSISAISQEFDGIAWLDVDNWFDQDHVERMVRVAQTAAVVTAARKLRRVDGSILGVCSESDGITFNDTNCYLVTRAAFPIVCRWGFKNRLDSVVGDRIVWQAFKNSGASIGRSDEPTVNYTSRVAIHYIKRGETPPADARIIVRYPDDVHPRSVLYADHIDWVRRHGGAG